MSYMVKIDPQKMRNFLRDNRLTQTEVSQAIGKSRNYLSVCLVNREISATALQLIGVKYGIREQDVAPESPPGGDAPTGFSLSLLVKPDRVRVGVMHNGDEIYAAFARVNGNTELKLIQAISYAAHMCYKKAEQKELEAIK